ncbi:MAG: membrane protein insertion efficiency factor YidD [Bacteroidales bacterium]
MKPITAPLSGGARSTPRRVPDANGRQGATADAREPGPAADWPRPGLLARAALVAIAAYKLLLSPLFAGACRFTPSCADYTAEAIRQHGAWRGALLGARRLARCHPLGPSGFDPVPSQPLFGARRPKSQVRIRHRTSDIGHRTEFGHAPTGRTAARMQ